MPPRTAQARRIWPNWSGVRSFSVLRLSWQASGLAEALRAFYALHSPQDVPHAPGLAKEYLGREKELNEALMRKYGQNLTTMAVQVDGPSPTFVQSNEIFSALCQPSFAQ